MMWASIKWI